MSGNLAYTVPTCLENEDNFKTSPLGTLKTRENISGSFETMSAFSDGSKRQRGITSSGQPITLDIREIRQNARNAYRLSTVARSIIRRINDIVIDSGLKFKSNPLFKTIGISETQAQDMGEIITERFELFMKNKCFTTNESMNGYQFQRFSFTNYFRDGESFVKLNRKRRENSNAVSELSIQPIDPNQVENPEEVVRTDGYNDDFIDGISYYSDGRPKTYSVVTKKEGFYKTVKVPAESSSGLKFMLHSFTPEYSDQPRGISLIGHILQELEDILNLDQAHILTAIAQSSLAIAVESDGEEDSVNPFPNNTVPSGLVQRDLSVTSTENAVTNEGISWKAMPEAQLNVPGGVTIFGLPGKQRVKPLENTAPVANYHQFVDSFVAYLAAASDISIEVLLMRFGQNYSASLATLTLAWRIAEIYRQEFVSDIMNEILTSFIQLEIANSRIMLPGWNNPIIRSAWLNGVWLGTSKPVIDPFKESKATEMNIKIGRTDIETEARNYNGSDANQNIKKNKKLISKLVPYPWDKKDSSNNNNTNTINKNSTKTGE